MVGQTQSTSDQPQVTENISNETVAGSGAVIDPTVSDSVGFTEAFAQSQAGVSVVLDSTFSHLNGRSMFKHEFASALNLEKLVLAKATFGTNITYSTGGIIIDLSQIRGAALKNVYVCAVLNGLPGIPALATFIPDPNNLAEDGMLKFFDNTGSELANGSNSIQGMVLQLYIRGN